MIRLPLEEYGFRALPERPDVVVDVYAEGALVELSIELEAGEVTPHYKRREGATVAIGRLHALSNDDGLELAGALFDAEEALARSRDEREVSRRLLPSEARALAAVLVHFAGEADR